jgi:hypothetical protein
MNLGLTDRYTAENRFEVDGANAARSFLKGRGISTQQIQVVWDGVSSVCRQVSFAPLRPPVVVSGLGDKSGVDGEKRVGQY